MQSKDDGAWNIPKGLIGAGEAPLSAARREFAEETRHDPEGVFSPLGEAQQPGGKVVQACAIEGDWDPALIRSNTFEMEWPPRSGRLLSGNRLSSLVCRCRRATEDPQETANFRRSIAGRTSGKADG